MDQTKRIKSKYKRLKTLMKKVVEVSMLCELQANLLVYDPKFHKLTENYTTGHMKIESVQQMINSIDTPYGGNRKAPLKFNSVDATLQVSKRERIQIANQLAKSEMIEVLDVQKAFYVPLPAPQKITLADI